VTRRQSRPTALCVLAIMHGGVAEIVFEIYFRIAKWHAVLLEQRVYLEASLELKEPADLSLRQGADAIPLNGDRLERPSRDIVPSTSERRRHIFR
jgi:hypothetical protein